MARHRQLARQQDILPADRGNIGHAHDGHGAGDFRLQNFQRPARTRFTGCTNPVEGCAAYGDGISPQGQALENIAAPAHAAIGDDRQPVTGRVHDRGQGIPGCHGGVVHIARMVGDEDPVGAAIRSHNGVFRVQHAFDQQLMRPGIPHSAEEVPGEGFVAIEEAGRFGRNVASGFGLGLFGNVDVREGWQTSFGEVVAARGAHQPARVLYAVDGGFQGHLGGKDQPVAHVDFPIVVDRGVDSDDQSLKSRIQRPFDGDKGGFRIAPDIKLKPLRAATIGVDFLHGGVRRAGQGKRDAGLVGGTRQFGFPAIPDKPGRPGGANDQREALFLAKKGNSRVTTCNVAHHAGDKLDPVQRGPVVAHGHLILAALIAEIEQRLGETTFCHLAQVFDVQCFAR